MRWALLSLPLVLEPACVSPQAAVVVEGQCPPSLYFSVLTTQYLLAALHRLGSPLTRSEVERVPTR